MHTYNPKVLDKLAIAYFSAVGDGMHVELCPPGASARVPEQPFMTFREDEELGKQVVIHCQAGDLAFPLEELKRAIAIVDLEVHKESFYD